MTIWSYQAAKRSTEEVKRLLQYRQCVFCQDRLVPLDAAKGRSEFQYPDVTWVTLYETVAWLCPVCGWWIAQQEHAQYPVSDRPMKGIWSTQGAVASIRELDLTDIDAPLDEVRQYLAARYDKRYDLHPRLFEQTVASVFGSLGYTTLVTAYSGDGGIDVVLSGDTSTVGVQVKRWKNRIDVEQIRAFAGALVLQGLTEGVFVTTSAFQSGVQETAGHYKDRGYDIRLLNAEEFYAELKIAQRAEFSSAQELIDSNLLEHMVTVGGHAAY